MDRPAIVSEALAEALQNITPHSRALSDYISALEKDAARAQSVFSELDRLQRRVAELEEALHEVGKWQRYAYEEDALSRGLSLEKIGAHVRAALAASQIPTAGIPRELDTVRPSSE